MHAFPQVSSVPYRDVVGHADKTDTEDEREAGGSSIGERGLTHEEGCVDHGKLVNKLHWV